VAGDGATGKTSATLDMACRTTGGGAWPDGGRAPSCDVILISSEDSLRMKVRPFVDAHGGDPHRIQILKSTQLSPDGTGERDFDLENDIKALERAIVETGARVVFISPLSAYLGKKDSYKDAEIRGILRPLSDLADRHRVALVAILHVTKDSDRQFIHRILGSVAFSNQARLVLGCGIDPRAHGQSNFIMASVKNSVGAKPPTLAYRIETRIQRYDDGRAIEVGGLTWDKDPVEGDVNQLLNPKRPMPRHERDEATAFLLETLKDGPVAFKDIERAAQQRGIADRTLKRAKGELGIVAEQPVDTSKRKLPSVWRLPDYA
jgi:hypothetical protein